MSFFFMIIILPNEGGARGRLATSAPDATSGPVAATLRSVGDGANRGRYLATASSSTSNTRSAFGGMAPPMPCAP
jgi:hypothetical protein